MSILGILLGFAAIIIGIILILKNNLIEFVIFWIIIASASDSAGVALMIDEQFSVYTFIMHCELLVCTLRSLDNYHRRRNHKFDSWNSLILVSVFMTFISFVVAGLEGLDIYKAVPVVCEACPLSVLIIICNIDRYRIDLFHYFRFLVYFQNIFCFLIIYLPLIEINILDVFKSSHYVEGGYIYNRSIFHISDLRQAISAKYLYNGLGQFHNANDAGFYGVVGIIVALYTLKNNKKPTLNIISVFVIYISILLWGNSGMRGPVIGLGIGVIIYVFLIRENSKFIMMIGLILSAALFMFTEIGMELLGYLIPSFENISVSGRKVLRDNGLKFIAEHPIFGSGGMIQRLTDTNTNPHELPLRFACLFGIPTALLLTYILFVKPSVEILRHKKDWISIILFSIIVMVAMTDNYTDFGLYQFAFSIVLIYTLKSDSVKEVKDVL